MNAIIPVPRCEVSIRPATLGDYAFIDRLQQMHTKALGFMPRKQLEEKILAGNILVAWATRPCLSPENQDMGESPMPQPIGYVMSQDRYFKRDDVGIVYQLNIAPGHQRSLVGASLIKAVFDRAAYGCRLFCCWCAQDLNANYFWEALGFIPLAFRAGAKGKRAHIFWQKRIREGDASTPYWYPCKTDGGHMREGRIVLPIPPGVKWSDAMPILLPEVARATRPCLLKEEKTTGGLLTAGAPVPRLRKPKDMGETPMLREPTTKRVRFGGPSAITEPEPVKEKPKRVKKAKVKIDPTHLAKARELRDRYLEQFNSADHRQECLCHQKYEVSRVIEAKVAEVKLLAA